MSARQCDPAAKKILTRASLLAALVIAVAATSDGRELYRQRVEPPPRVGGAASPGSNGGGWIQRAAEVSLGAPVSFEAARRGYVSFDLRRLPSSNPAKPGTVFELLDRDGKKVFRVLVSWSSDVDPGRGTLCFLGGGSDFNRNSLGLWSPVVPLDREVEPNQTIHVDLTWDDAARDYGIYVDGRPLNSRPGSFDRTSREFARDARERINEANRKQGLPTVFPEQPFSYFLARVRRVALGHVDEPRRAAWRERTLLDNAALENFVVGVDEPLETLQAAGHDVKNLQGTYGKEGVLLTWEPPEVLGIDQAYAVYRRAGAEGNARFERLTVEPLRDVRYLDTAAKAGETYRYSVASLYGDLRGGTLEGKDPPEVTVTAAAVCVRSVAAERAVYGPGQEIVVTLRGTADLQARFTLQAIAADVSMAEVDDGVYVGKAKVPAGLSLGRAALRGTLFDAASGATVSLTGATVEIDGVPPEPISRIIASVPWPGEIEVAWEASPSADVDRYLVYRHAGAEPPDGRAEPYGTVKTLSFVDRAVIPGLLYRYAVTPIDHAGNRAPLSEVVSVTAVPGDGPRISEITVEPLGRPARPGESVTVTVTAASGAKASVDIGELAKGLPAEEQGRTGRYIVTYRISDTDVAPAKSAHRLVVHLADAFGASAQAGPELLIVGRDVLDDKTSPAIAGAAHDGSRVTGISGRLVAGDVVTVSMEGEPGGYAHFDVTGVVQGVAMAEASPGHYSGGYTVRPGDAGVDLPVSVHLSDEAGNETALLLDHPVSFDTRVRLTVAARNALLPADRKSQTQLTARAADANGRPVADHELALTLSTTEEYTGVVGGGRLEGREARASDDDNVEVRWGGVSNGFGEVGALYTAGFAAKTALIVAKDLTTGDVGAGWLNTYVAATVAIELVPRAKKGAEDRALLRITADPPKLTADGRSTSRVRVWLADLAGSPLAGAPIHFSLANDNGRLRVLRATTDAKGLAEAEYRAGTAMGTVTITAAAADYGVTASAQIVLMADAPAKIDLVTSAQKLVADGAGKATLSVRVVDANDNPNHEVPVSLTVLAGSGHLSKPSVLTDRNGEAQVTFTAGTKPGIATVEARHTSRPPSVEELRRVYGTLFLPRLFKRQERDRLKLTEWLVKPGEAVGTGQDLAVVESPRGQWTLTARAKGVFVREVKREGDGVELGDTVGYVEIDPDVWASQYVAP